MNGLGIPVEIKTNIYGEEVTFEITPPSRKAQKEIDAKAKAIDAKDPKECVKMKKEYESISEEMGTYDLKTADAEERKEYRALLKKKNKLEAKIEKECPNRQEELDDLFTQMIRNMITSDNRDDITEKIIENVSPAEGYYWLISVYGDEMGKRSKES